jgi:hypothetical protein
VSDYPPSTQSDDSSPLYRALVKQHELRQLGQIDRERVDWAIATRFAEVKPVATTPEQEQEPVALIKPLRRICPVCKMELKDGANGNSKYCSSLCQVAASRLAQIREDSKTGHRR